MRPKITEEYKLMSNIMQTIKNPEMFLTTWEHKSRNYFMYYL